jgi:NAD(P)-dependent dehydrogenase (short-subunit alcohol dehydrogenase family)
MSGERELAMLSMEPSKEDLGCRGPLIGQVAVVTGAGKGIGRAAAFALHEAGAAIVGLGRTPGDGPGTVGRLAAEITAAGGAVLGITCDVRRPDHVAAAFAQAVDRFARLDVLVNNAGIFRRPEPTEDTDPAAWAEALETNLTGAFLCARAAIPHLRVRGGAIINVVGSTGSLDAPRVVDVATSVSKAGMYRLTTYMADELAGSGIAVNTLDPMGLWTEGTARVFPEAADDPVWGRPSDIAPAIVFLARQRSELTGQTVRHDEVARWAAVL